MSPTVTDRYESGSNSIRTQIETAVAALAGVFPALSPVPVTFDNSPMRSQIAVIPVGGAGQAPSALGAVELAASIIWKDAQRRGTAGHGLAAYRFTGKLRFTVMARMLDGDGVTREVADYLADAFRFDSVSGVEFHVPYFTQGAGTISAESSFTRTVEIPFYYDADSAILAGATGSSANFDAIGEVCRTRFDTLVATPGSLAVVYDNAYAAVPATTPWIALDVLHGSSEAVSFGMPTKRFRHAGLLQASIFVDAGIGDGDALGIADDIFNAFHSAAEGGVSFKTPAVVASGRVGSYWRVLMQVPYSAETIQ